MSENMNTATDAAATVNINKLTKPQLIERLATTETELTSITAAAAAAATAAAAELASITAAAAVTEFTVNSELLPLLSEADAASKLENQRTRLTAIDAELLGIGEKLATEIAAGNSDAIQTLGTESSALAEEKTKLKISVDKQDGKVYEAVTPVIVEFVPTCFGLLKTVDFLETEIHRQISLRNAFIDTNGESDDDAIKALVTEYTTDIAKLTVSTAATANSIVKSDGSAQWISTAREHNATAVQVSELRKVHADALSRKEKRPMRFVTDKAQELGILYQDENDPDVLRDERNDAWTSLAKIAGHLPEHTLAKTAKK